MIRLLANNEEPSDTIVVSCYSNGQTKCYHENCEYSTKNGQLMRRSHFRLRHPNDILINKRMNFTDMY